MGFFQAVVRITVAKNVDGQNLKAQQPEVPAPHLDRDQCEFNGPQLVDSVGNDPLNSIDPFGLQTQVIIWNAVGSGESSQGHVSIVINGTSYSWGPGSGGDSGTNKCCKPGNMDIEAADAYIGRNTFRSGLGYNLSLTHDQEHHLSNFLKNYKGNYNLFGRNCVTPIVQGLHSIGVNLTSPMSPITGLPQSITTPEDLNYAFSQMGTS